MIVFDCDSIIGFILILAAAAIAIGFSGLIYLAITGKR